jgi:hypothetical protein
VGPFAVQNKTHEATADEFGDEKITQPCGKEEVTIRLR